MTRQEKANEAFMVLLALEDELQQLSPEQKLSTPSPPSTAPSTTAGPGQDASLPPPQPPEQP